jgi:hypothetical protein
MNGRNRETDWAAGYGRDRLFPKLADSCRWSTQAITPKDCFYEDSLVKLFLMSACIGGASWAPHEGVADAS